MLSQLQSGSSLIALVSFLIVLRVMQGFASCLLSVASQHNAFACSSVSVLCKWIRSK